MSERGEQKRGSKFPRIFFVKDSDNFAHCVSGYLCITIGGSDCAAERLPPHSSFIAGHNERLIQGENLFFSKVG